MRTRNINRDRSYGRQDRQINNNRNYGNRYYDNYERSYGGHDNFYENENYGIGRDGSQYSDDAYRRNDRNFDTAHNYDDRNVFERAGDRIRNTWDRLTDDNDRDYDAQYRDFDYEDRYSRDNDRRHENEGRNYRMGRLDHNRDYNQNYNSVGRGYDDFSEGRISDRNYYESGRGRREFNLDERRRRRDRHYSV
jgi:hypothetical protein